ncbi:uncharacterized protein LOC119070489 [Bradysia coprophila]|uniref:uncharacterized protein LOC119070489 n=1 Tax=Bradysia coprophila TaxID=38358 RepID=UPI00187DB191|nr:uncharacterized protein LOC119070489 [Bradysia coprophila]
MLRNIFFVIVVSVAVISADEKTSKYTQVIQPASRQLPATHDGYQSDAVYAQQSAPYPMAYQPAEGIYPPANEDVGADTQAHQAEQPLENPNYDSGVYPNYGPQDNVQQYVSSYGGPYAPGVNAVGYPIYGGGYGPSGFGVQTGFEGYYVPSGVPIPPPPPPPGPAIWDLFRNNLPYPRTMLSMLMRSGTYLLSSIGVVLFGGAVTTAICTFTPLCTISFAALPLLGLRETLNSKTIKESIASEITSDRVRRAAEFLRTALEKYNQIQEDTSKEAKSEAAGTSAVAKKVSATSATRR